jgi:hypothetical protein
MYADTTDESALPGVTAIPPSQSPNSNHQLFVSPDGYISRLSVLVGKGTKTVA